MGMDIDVLGRELFRVLETTDPDLAARVVDDGFHNREAAVAPPACATPGPAGVLASSAWMRFAFDDLHFEILGAARNADQLWLRLRMQGRHTGPFVRFREGVLDQALPPTGRRIDFEQIHVLGVRDGKVVRHEAVRDAITMLGQLGVFPPAPAALRRVIGWKLTGRAGRAAAQVTEEAARAASLAGAAS